MKVKLLTETAKLPTRANSGDLGYDLYADQSCWIMPGESQLIKTGIAIEFPDGYGGFIKDRSSVASKRGLFTHAGVIDNGYRGEILILINNGSNDSAQYITAGEKIAQLVFIPVTNFGMEAVEEFSNETDRGTDGFGSSGI